MADEFQLNDPVTISTTGSGDSSTLEGIVAHLGPVQFAPGIDWIGIRLTGASVGSGKNNGTVKKTGWKIILCVNLKLFLYIIRFLMIQWFKFEVRVPCSRFY